MAKNAKKNLRMRKQIRRTMGIICLITAIVVAAIPVPGASAADGTTEKEGEKYTWEKMMWNGDMSSACDERDRKTDIPLLKPSDSDKIYTTGDGTYQFAFMSSAGYNYAIILGYNDKNLEENTLIIPDEVNAYRKFNDNQGSFQGYVAASKSGEALFYDKEEWEIIRDENGKEMKDENGELLKKLITKFYPCYYNDRNAWQDRELERLYYLADEQAWREGTDDIRNYLQPCRTDINQWIKNLKVFYIGNQTIIADDNGWKIYEKENEINSTETKGIFANNSNIVSLEIGDFLKGIGNYAFYGCTSLTSVEVGNGIKEIGKEAFAYCTNLTSVNIPSASNLTFISDRTFLNCRMLDEFVLPNGVKEIYDRAFEGCWSLKTIDISGKTFQGYVNLQDFGYYVFKDCINLKKIVIPASFSGKNNDNKLVLNNFKNCSSLESIEIETAGTSSNIEPVATNELDDIFEIDHFYNYYDKDVEDKEHRSRVNKKFSFKCVYDSKVRDVCRENAIPFNYVEIDGNETVEVYELYKEEGGGQTLYQASKGKLTCFNSTNITDKKLEVNIPSSIATEQITGIGESCFLDNCNMIKITIPSCITVIEANAFKGCHNLKDVIFENALTITQIDEGAFATQVRVDAKHDDYCDDKKYLKDEDGDGVVEAPELSFSGTVGSNVVPFKYAMNTTANINTGAQPLTYITYYSGWPTNLTIQYNHTNERAELVDYPRYNEISDYKIDSFPYMTKELKDAATTAIQQYNKYGHIENTEEISENQWAIINAALKIVLPEGITGIKRTVNDTTEELESIFEDDIYIKSISMASIEEFEEYTFKGCTALEEINITGGAEKIGKYAFAEIDGLKSFNMSRGGAYIGDYAFENDANLETVKISANVNELGKRPFAGCSKLAASELSVLSFGGGPYFVCEDAIVYKKEDGVKTTIVQCLESRSKTIKAKELVGIKILTDEAFENCDKLGSIDLSQSYIERVPYHAFANTDNLYEVILPNTCKSITKNAFEYSMVTYVEIPGSVTYIDPNAFDTYAEEDKDKPEFRQIEFFCEPGSAAETYANEYYSVVISERDIEKYFTVTFWDYVTASGAPSDTLSIVKEQTVLWHTAATAPEPAGREGYRFTGWSLDFSDVSRDMDVQAMYEKIDSEETKYTVTFIDWNDQVLYTQTVAPGQNAITPQNPTRQGYTFTGWRPAITNVQSDITTYAQYEYGTWIDTNGDGIPDKVVDDNTGGGNGNTGGNGGNGGNNTPTTLYTLTVKNGSGSGSYAAGAQVPVIANEPVAGQKFDKWISENPAATFISSSVGATFMVMPAGNVTIEATYKKDPNYNGNTGTGGSGSGNTNVPGSTTKPGTIIVIDKNGLSNTGVVSGTVYGSSDNFVIKISEDTDATEEVLKALLNEFGSVENLKYFPMDISLYDSTGKTKITDTSGLSIKITLPLPDSMIKYAGNNKVAGVVHERLDKLSTRFATIDGVPCVTFTAEHFSPYVIYVDVSDLSSSGTVDESPKTGDIHPKWFFVIGLGCIGIFLFLKRDKKEKFIVA